MPTLLPNSQAPPTRFRRRSRALARSFLEPLLRAGSAMRTSRPPTGTAFARLKLVERALDSADTRCFLSGRDYPTGPFVARQRRQIRPSRSRHRLRVERPAQVDRGFVQGTRLARFALVFHFFVTVPRTYLSEQSRLTAMGAAAARLATRRLGWQALQEVLKAAIRILSVELHGHDLAAGIRAELGRARLAGSAVVSEVSSLAPRQNGANFDCSVGAIGPRSRWARCH
jgi:hypothetical protein